MKKETIELKVGDKVSFLWNSEKLEGTIINVSNENERTSYVIKNGYDVYRNVVFENITII